MHVDPNDFPPLVRAFAALMRAMGISTAAGRVMLGMEFVLGIFLLLALALVLAHEIYESVYHWLRDLPQTFHSTRHFIITVATMFLSLIAVFVREMIQTLPED